MITAKTSPSPIRLFDTATIDPKEFGAIANGKSHPLRERFETREAANYIFPHAESLDEEIDWAAFQAALNEGRSQIQTTVAQAGGSIGRTSLSYAPVICPSPGHYIINRPLMVYPHTSIRGADWGHTVIRLADSGWAQSAPRLTTNKEGVYWAGKIDGLSALLWLQGDEEWPAGSGLKVSGMVNSISNIWLKCSSGAAIYNAGNQNQIAIYHVGINGYGEGPTGLGIISNNATSSTQITNPFIHDNMIEGCRAAMVFDKLQSGSIHNNQIESCSNGIYVGHGAALHIDGNVLTNDIKRVLNGIFVGLGFPLSISGNTLNGVEEKAIKVLGRAITIANNRILIKNGAAINKSGYGIHIVGPTNQFGGDLTVLNNRLGVHHVHGNVIDIDVVPTAKPLPGSPNPQPLVAIWAELGAGKSLFTNNVDPSSGYN